MTKKITMRDVAREAGVSVATVSYVLNNQNCNRISEATKKKVWQIINLLNYRPNQNAKALSTNKSGNIALCADNNAEQFSFALKLSLALHNRGYRLILVPPFYTGVIDTAEAIICKDISRHTFLEIANNNLVPLLAVDSEINHPLFFQITSSCQDEKTIDRKIDILINCLQLAIDRIPTEKHHIHIEN